MRTLYESILDDDAMNRMEDDVQTSVLREKTLKSILNAITKVIINLKLDYNGESNSWNSDSLYRMDSDGARVYEFVRTFYPKDSEPPQLSDIESDLIKAFKKYKYELVRLENEHSRQEILFSFRQSKLPLSIIVSLVDVRVPAGTKWLQISIAGGKNDGLVINQIRRAAVTINLKRRNAK